MSKTKHNRSFLTMVMITLAFAMMVTGCLTSCNTERRAERLIDKGDRIDGRVMPRKCAERFPSTNSKDSIYIYKQGEPIVIQDTVTLFDTVNNTVTKYITRTVNTTDTVVRNVRITEVNRAKEVELSNKVHDLDRALAKKTAWGKLWMWIAISEGVLILIWVVKKIWLK